MKITDEYKEVIHRLAPTSAWASSEDKIIWRDDSVPEPTDKEIKAEIARYDKEFADNEYARNRASAFPSIGDQLDMQYWDSINGTTTWKDAVAKVKADNPKPE